jgi:hypothetical protein
MNPNITPKVATRFVCELFIRFSEKEMRELLETAGVVPCKDKSLMLQQALNVWFHGDIPSLDEFIQFVNEHPIK